MKQVESVILSNITSEVKPVGAENIHTFHLPILANGQITQLKFSGNLPTDKEIFLLDVPLGSIEPNVNTLDIICCACISSTGQNFELVSNSPVMFNSRRNTANRYGLDIVTFGGTEPMTIDLLRITYAVFSF